MNFNERIEGPSLLNRNIVDLIRSIPLRRIGRGLLAGNPFYLISAAMMLYGIYLVSVDPQMLGEEASKLAFNFSSLQLYEILLVVTAIVLARREIWYDSTLLVALENMFVLVPFILVSQAVLLDQRLAWAFCLGGSAFAVAKLWGLKRYIKELNLPTDLLLYGSLVLIVNLVFPPYFRTVISLDNEAWTAFSPYLWYLFLPLLMALANLLPRPNHWGGLSPKRNWLPQVFFWLWVAVTAVHVASMDYVDNQKFHYFRLAPVMWMLVWTLYHRVKDFTRDVSPRLRLILLALPVVVTALALWSSKSTTLFCALAALNAVIYGWMCIANHQRQAVWHLLLFSIAAVVAGMPVEWGRELVPAFSREKCAILALGTYAFILASTARDAKYSLLGAILAGLGTVYFFDRMDYVEQYAMQNALLYLLMHSLRWGNEETPGERPLRMAAACAWVLHSFVWGNIGGLSVAAPVALSGLLMLGMYYLVRRMTGQWGSKVILHAAWLVMATVPANYVVEILRITPRGYLIVLGSFILFALGTAFALTRDRWTWLGGKATVDVKPVEIVPRPTGETG